MQQWIKLYNNIPSETPKMSAPHLFRSCIIRLHPFIQSQWMKLFFNANLHAHTLCKSISLLMQHHLWYQYEHISYYMKIKKNGGRRRTKKKWENESIWISFIHLNLFIYEFWCIYSCFLCCMMLIVRNLGMKIILLDFLKNY